MGMAGQSGLACCNRKVCRRIQAGLHLPAFIPQLACGGNDCCSLALCLEALVGLIGSTLAWERSTCEASTSEGAGWGGTGRESGRNATWLGCHAGH